MQLPLTTTNSVSSEGTQSVQVDPLRTRVQQLFARTSMLRPRSTGSDESKAPRLGLQNFSHSRLDLPHLHSPRLSSPNSPSMRSPVTSSPLASPHPLVLDSLRISTGLVPAPRRSYASPSQLQVQAVPEDNDPAQLEQQGRWWSRPHRTVSDRLPTKTALRSKIIGCLVSGFLLISVLTIYLSLALSSRAVHQHYHVVLILFILFITIYFCHSLVRLCMLAMGPASSRATRNRVPSTAGPGGYANPPEPIRVVTRHDEEAVGIESEAAKAPPPAYGLWRCSVRVDPNLLHWQRRNDDEANTQLPPGLGRERVESRPCTPNRPPSYVSDDGVEYVVSANARSTTIYEEPPLPPHPSEIGRAFH
ncbi:MAG: hypothetical protein M1837_000554 [Sclerophora amabilis]|nr:MAG: hypothetical protein M1837_000554 [Sclerophora amabilis]